MVAHPVVDLFWDAYILLETGAHGPGGGRGPGPVTSHGVKGLEGYGRH